MEEKELFTLKLARNLLNLAILVIEEHVGADDLCKETIKMVRQKFDKNEEAEFCGKIAATIGTPRARFASSIKRVQDTELMEYVGEKLQEIILKNGQQAKSD